MSIFGIDSSDNKNSSNDDTLEKFDITGFVTDENGNPVTNKIIEFQNSTIICALDFEGKYYLNNVILGKGDLNIKDKNGNIIAKLKIETKLGNVTGNKGTSITTDGKNLELNLKLVGRVLSINSVRAKKIIETESLILYVLIISAAITLILLIIFIRTKQVNGK